MSPWHVLLVALAGWLNREQQKVIEYLKEENRVLREQLGAKRLVAEIVISAGIGALKYASCCQPVSERWHT